MLDCSSTETTLESLASIVGADVQALRKRVASLQPGPAFSQQLSRYPYTEVVWSQCVDRPVEELVQDLEIAWFHGTRLAPSTSFAAGLLPLAASLNDLRATVTKIADGLRLPPHLGAPSPSYIIKMSCLSEQGPFGSLLRDAVVRPVSPHRDFLASPEIVEDLAMRVAGDRFNEVIREYQKFMKPCIVKFRSREPRPDALKCALAYCHASLIASDEPTHWNTCFDGRGTLVPADNILSVEWLDG